MGCTEPYKNINGPSTINSKYGWNSLSGIVSSNYTLPEFWVSDGNSSEVHRILITKFPEYYGTDIRITRTPRNAIISCLTFSELSSKWGQFSCHNNEGINVFRADGSGKWLKSNWDTHLGPDASCGAYKIFGWANAPHNR